MAVCSEAGASEQVAGRSYSRFVRGEVQFFSVAVCGPSCFSSCEIFAAPGVK